MKLLEEILKIKYEMLDEFDRRVEALEEEEQEFPQDGDEYWYIGLFGAILSGEWVGGDAGTHLLTVGNVYKTDQEAVFALEKLKVEAELRKFSTEYQPYAEIYNIVFHNNSKKVITVTANQTFQDITFHFESEEKAQQAIQSVGEERIKKYIFGVED